MERKCKKLESGGAFHPLKQTEETKSQGLPDGHALAFCVLYSTAQAGTDKYAAP